MKSFDAYIIRACPFCGSDEVSAGKSSDVANIQKRLNELEAQRLLVAARCSAAPSEPRAVINGKVVTGKELLEAFRAMPKGDRQSLLEDLRLLDSLEAEAQQNVPHEPCGANNENHEHF